VVKGGRYAEMLTLMNSVGALNPTRGLARLRNSDSDEFCFGVKPHKRVSPLNEQLRDFWLTAYLRLCDANEEEWGREKQSRIMDCWVLTDWVGMLRAGAWGLNRRERR
jgi:hypothetical protein